MRSKVAVNSVGLEELAALDELALALSLVALEVAGEPLSAALLSSVGPPQLTKSPRERTLTNKDFLFIMFFYRATKARSFLYGYIIPKEAVFTMLILRLKPFLLIKKPNEG